MPSFRDISSQWNRTKDQTERLRNEALNVNANEDVQQAFLEEADANQDGKLTASELLATVDADKDGYLSDDELKALAIKARAGDFDRTTIKALGQMASARSTVTLFSKNEDGLFVGSEFFEAAKDNFQTVIPHNPRTVYPSRNLDRVRAIEPGVLAIQEQEGNSCGTTSLSMLMSYYQGHTLENAVPTIDNYIRANSQETSAFAQLTQLIELDGFTAPRDIVNYANDRGFRAGMQNDASIGQIKSYLDQGVPVMVLTDWNFKSGGERPRSADPDGASLHWVNVIGYEYAPHPDTEEPELQLVIANPHGRVQRVNEHDFLDVWSNLKLSVTENREVDTGMNRLLVAMVPSDESREIVAPDGQVRQAGDIAIPDGSDGLGGWAAQKASELMQAGSRLQENFANRNEQLIQEGLNGYARDGIKGLLSNLWSGDTEAIGRLRERAKSGDTETKAEILQELLNKGINRSQIQQLIYDILRDVPFGRDFDALLARVDTGQLAQRLENDSQAGKVLAWIAKSEADASGRTGPKFDAFARVLSKAHRHAALDHFLSSEHTQNHKLLQKVPAATVRTLVQDLMSGWTSGAEQKTIYELIRHTSPDQFTQLMSRLDMGQVAAELDSDRQLGNLTAWVIDNAIDTGNWTNLNEILRELSSLSNYTRADDVLGYALTHSSVKNKTGQIPAAYRNRMIDLLNDMSRWRSDEAVTALRALRRH